MDTPENPYAPPQAEILAPSQASEAAALASPWKRLGAVMLDGLIILVVMAPAMWLSGHYARVTEMSQRGGMWMPENLLWAVLSFLVLIVINWRALGRGQTIGKSALHLRIVSKDGSPATRSQIILKRMLPLQLVSQIPVVGGLVTLVDSLCIFRSGRNTLHDDIANTKVVDLDKITPVS